jgi:tetratricopeptide (TPR) repeat protein
VTLDGRQPITTMRIVRDNEKGGRFFAPIWINVKLSFRPAGGSTTEAALELRKERGLVSLPDPVHERHPSFPIPWHRLKKRGEEQMAGSGGRIFHGLVPRPFQTWQVGTFRMPFWVHSGEEPPFRPWAAICLNLETGLVEAPDRYAEGNDPGQLAVAAVRRAAKKWRARPKRIEVSDPALAGALQEALSGEGVAVQAREHLPELQSFFALMGKDLVAELPPDVLSGAGVTVEQVAAFAEAGARFFAAAPWTLLSNDDLLHIEAPEMQVGLRYLSVMGAAEEQFGLFFVHGREQWEALLEGRLKALDSEGVWTVSFEPPWEVPPGDLDLWESRGLAREAGGRLPVAAHMKKRTLTRPEARILSFLEGLMTALASTSEAEMDTGRWEKEVHTHHGPLRFRLSLPLLFERDRAQEIVERYGRGAKGRSPEAAAAELVDAAWDARGQRRRVVLARKALEIWPDCADAYVLLGRSAATPERAREFFAEGVAAGERALGPDVFRDDAGHFWGLVETRPYMRAREWLAESLWQLGRREEAMEHFEDMLRLNPEDNQAIRHRLANLLLDLERHDRLIELLDRYSEDPFAEWSYSRALLAFRLEGDSTEAMRRLQQALKANRYVPDYLLGRKALPRAEPPGFSFGRDDEAATYALHAIELWKKTPGALDWLKRRTSGSRPKPGRSGKKRRF